MNIYKTELFPYIQGDSMVGKSVTLTIKGIAAEKLNNKGQSETKYVLYFEETIKGLVLNKTNAARIAALYGGETDDWTGKRITLYTEKVRAFGGDHNAVRVEERKPAPVKNGKPAKNEDPFPGKVDEDHPDPVSQMDTFFPSEDDDEMPIASGAYAE